MFDLKTRPYERVETWQETARSYWKSDLGLDLSCCSLSLQARSMYILGDLGPERGKTYTEITKKPAFADQIFPCEYRHGKNIILIRFILQTPLSHSLSCNIWMYSWTSS